MSLIEKYKITLKELNSLNVRLHKSNWEKVSEYFNQNSKLDNYHTYLLADLLNRELKL